MLPVKTLVDRDQKDGEAVIPPGLRELYDGDLRFPSAPQQRPYVFGNFVTTLDGVVSYRIPGHSGGSTISGSDPADRFIMGLLRASADAIVVGAGTVHDVNPEHLWIPAFTFPEAKELYRQYRVDVLRKPEQPLLAVVTGSGALDLNRAIFRTPEMQVVIVTSSIGYAELEKAGVSALTSTHVKVVENVKTVIAPQAILHMLRSEFGVQSVLHEGGPTLFARFVAHQAVDELFLTLAPQLAGRLSHTIHPGMIQGVEFTPDTAPWLHLVSSKQGTDHLYLRYRR